MFVILSPSVWGTTHHQHDSRKLEDKNTVLRPVTHFVLWHYHHDLQPSRFRSSRWGKATGVDSQRWAKRFVFKCPLSVCLAGYDIANWSIPSSPLPILSWCPWHASIQSAQLKCDPPALKLALDASLQTGSWAQVAGVPNHPQTINIKSFPWSPFKDKSASDEGASWSHHSHLGNISGGGRLRGSNL